MDKEKPVKNTIDSTLITRVRKYLEENVHQTFVDVNAMAKSLQERHRDDYNQMKLGQFRLSVEKAYKIVLNSYGLGSTSSDENDAEDIELMDANSNINNMNNMLTNLYSNSVKNTKQPVNINENDPINILSSDESSDEQQVESEKKKPMNTINNDQPEQTKKVPGKRNINQTDTNSVNLKLKKRRISQSGQPEDQLKIISLKPADVKVKTGDGVFLSRTRRFKKEVVAKKSKVNFRDIGGMEKVLKNLCEFLFHIKYPDLYHTIGISPPTGVLLHGPPGCGKTLLARAIAGQLKIGLIEIPATELIAGVSGESEERIREVFEQAMLLTPCVLFIDDIEAISSNRLNAKKDMERRVVSQLISCMDNLSTKEGLLIVGATTCPEILDPALRRVGRFDYEIAIGVPDKKERREILVTICDLLSMELHFDYSAIAEITPGYVGADLLALASRAASIAVKRKYLSKMRILQKNSVVNLTEDADNSNNPNVSKVSENGKNENKEEAVKGVQDTNVTEKLNGVMEVDEINNENDTMKSGENIQTTDGETMNTQNQPCVDEMNVHNGSNVEKSTENATPSTNTINEITETIDVDELPDCHPFVSKANELEDSVTKDDFDLYEMISLLNLGDNSFEDLYSSDICITVEDFKQAAKLVTPSAKREGFITVPDVTWDDIGSLRDIREELQLAILAPVKYPEKMKVLGLNAPSGVLLCGPPGCGKTLLAKAIANEAGINFISVKGPELMNMYVGESERAVRTCFQRARNSAPCVIFFDEFDSLCPRRSDSAEGGSGTRVVNQLLTEMDGIEDRKGVFLMAATNRPDIIDPAILRPGRLDTILYVGLPEEKDRIEILNALTKNGKQPVLADDVNLIEIANKTDGFTGADLAGIVRQASLLCLRDSLLNSDIKTEDLKVNEKHFTQAIQLCKPSVNAEDKKMYDKLRTKYAVSRKNIMNSE